ncbi:cAMP-binding domain of CRP or a regulatory subunit of cAMP-dependent protein kinases [Singulisphaera sp. GP187]|uniref:Crp/Fnr family transcriptional regulator n=1 Tax=Singulisphaera sp. GP187 TaxID=1882752 RepID=UPI0009286C43|nr:Crp/Fnr family transcriptional regulator [Singulisphaera sp. GP187]SIO66535.1 cAMP-binding domain of CRP or a regulatory subunit of cAMP-dependent protein kinases [Singulisphaera sp. GP187]
MSYSNHSPRNQIPSSGENRLLAALPADEYLRMLNRTVLLSLQSRDVLYRTGGAVEHVYFPRSGLISTVLVMLDGRAVEVGAVGREGMTGISAYLGADSCHDQVFCQVSAEVLQMPASVFAAEVRRSGQLQNVVSRYIRLVIDTGARLAACNCLHSVEERCARWLLMCRDSVVTDEFSLTQEYLALMLGVHRPSVTVAAGALQHAGLISYRHGRMTVLDRERLEEASCECYRAIKDESNRAFPDPQG